MNSPTNVDLLALETEIQQSGEISAQDVLALRRSAYKDGEIKKDEADLVLRLNRLARNADPAWDQFYVEALTDYFYWQRDDSAQLDEKDAELLISWISEDGRVDDRNEIKLLINIMSRSKGCPERLRHFVLNAIKESVLHSGEALYDNGVRQPGVVDEDDVTMIRSVIYGLGSEGGIAISKAEAELLFEINGQTATSKNTPSWQQLFVKAVTMFLLYKGDSPEEIDEDEAFWLESQIAEGRSCYRNEVALFDYLENETGGLPPRLQSLRHRLQAAQAAA